MLAACLTHASRAAARIVYYLAASGGRLLIDSIYYNNGTAALPIVIRVSATWGTGDFTYDASGMTSGANSAIVEVSQPLVETAGRFADVFALRGYDSVQLAAAHELHVNAEQTVVFASYDRRLNQAALLLQLEVLS
jgi:hypothetical protein